MKEKETVLWNEKVAEEVSARKNKVFVVEGMWTPSGFFHIGNARPEVFTPYAVKRALTENGKTVKQNLIIDDFDAVRKIPPTLNIPKEDEDKFLGFPCAKAPSPLPGFKTWADAFSSQLRKFAPKFGVELNMISAFESYKKGKFNDLIKFTIDHAEEIIKVWNEVAGTDKTEEFVPIQVMCQSCKKIYYTKIISFDGKEVEYECKCGEKGKISPYNGNSKLHWRVHWVAHWIVHKVDFESGGKDHFSKGGSVDVGRALIEKVFKETAPVQIPTEFIQMKGAKMSGSVGNVIDLENWLEVASPELFRYLNFSYKPNTVIELSFTDNSFVLLNNRFERAERIYYGIEKAENERIERNQKKAYEFSLIEKPPKQLVQLPFNTAIMFAQLFDFENNLDECISKISEVIPLSEKLSAEDKKQIQTKLRRVKKWLELYAAEDQKITFTEKFDSSLSAKLSAEIIVALKEIASNIPSAKTPDEIQQAIFNSAKSNKIPPKEIFQILYQALLGKKQGPKIGALTFAFGKEKVLQRLQELVDFTS